MIFRRRYTAVVRNRTYKKFFSKLACALWIAYAWLWPSVLMSPTLFGDWSGLG